MKISEIVTQDDFWKYFKESLQSKPSEIIVHSEPKIDLNDPSEYEAERERRIRASKMSISRYRAR